MVWLLPITFVVITAFKTNAEFYSTPVFSLPTSLAWENFERAFIRSNLYVYMGNGLFVSLCKLPIGIFLSSLTAFALTRLKLKHSNGIFILFLIGMMIPLQSILLPVCIAANGLNMTNNLLSLVVIYTESIFLWNSGYEGFMRAIPFEIDESARVDGCAQYEAILEYYHAYRQARHLYFGNS
ncbi:MAG: carbohydrate ABC transporter permease [Acutalibacteraceae bacterium]